MASFLFFICLTPFDTGWDTYGVPIHSIGGFVMYSVRLGKKHNTVYVLTPKGHVLRFLGQGMSREEAKKLSRQVRSRLKSGGKLHSAQWRVIR